MRGRLLPDMPVASFEENLEITCPSQHGHLPSTLLPVAALLPLGSVFGMRFLCKMLHRGAAGV